MTSIVGQYIESYPTKKFLLLTSRQQNTLLYQYLKCKDLASKSSTRVQKNKYLNKIIVTPQPKTLPIVTKKPRDRSVPTPDEGRSHSPTGGLRKLTEEVFEDALVRVLDTDPAKALGPALAFLDKKKSLSIEDTDTHQSTIAQDKMERKRKAMFT